MRLMESRIQEDLFNVMLTSKEVLHVQEGGMVGDRCGLLPDSKIEVFPGSSRDPDMTVTREQSMSVHRYTRGLQAKLHAELLGNYDLCLYIPDIALHDVRISYKTITRDKIETPHFSGADREEVLRSLPLKGVRLILGGSLRIIEPVRQLYQSRQG